MRHSCRLCGTGWGAAANGKDARKRGAARIEPHLASGRSVCYSYKRYRAVSRSQGTAPEAKMSVSREQGNGKVTVPALLQRKTAGDLSTQKITCLTAYDYPTARLLDEAGV